MASFSEFLQDYVNKSYEELLGFANLSLADLVVEMGKFFDDDTDDSVKMCMIITAACLGVDGKLTQLECQFLKELMDLDADYDGIREMVDSLGGSKAEELTDKFADSLSAKGKAALVTFCLSFLAVDETISREEVAFVKRLIED